MKKTIHLIFLIPFIFSLSLSAQNAPVTIAPFITGVVPGSVDVDIRVINFTSIGSFTLDLLYNPFVLTYSNASPNGSLNSSNFSVTSSSAGSGYYKVTISYPYETPSVTLSDSSILVTLSFTYTNGNGYNYSELLWSDTGSSCQYTDASDNILNDSPTGDYYHDGLVASQLAPVSILPDLNFYQSGSFELPITVNNFDHIGSVSLTFEYDSTVISFDGTYNSALTGLFADTLGSDSVMKRIVIGWFGTPETLSDGSQIVSLDFTYDTGATVLRWIDDGSSCDYADSSYNSLWDTPTDEFYMDGMIYPTPSPMVKADTVMAETDGLAIVPILVWNFNDIDSLSLTLDFDPDVLIYECATSNPDLGSPLKAEITESGRLSMSWWSATEESLADSSVLVYLAFAYSGNTSDLIWYNNGSTCEFTTGVSYTPLTDLPTSQFYFDGRVVPEHVPAIWKGATSGVWNLATNWLSNQSPDSSVDVIVTDTNSPSYWPVLTGNLTLGSQCRDITLEGAAEFTVTGDLSILPGRRLDISDNALLSVGGDWLNEGIFDPGEGTVDFNGDQQAIVHADVYPADYLANYGLSTFTVGMTDLTGATSGPSGDDAHSDVGIGFSFTYLGTSYTQVRINTNGWISLDQSGDDASSPDNSRLFYNGTPTTVLAPWWDDLDADGSSVISYKLEGSAPDRVFTVEWNNILSYPSDATSRLDFQVKLYETSNIIEFCYGDVTAGDHSASESASIGVNDDSVFLEATTGSNVNVITCLSSESSWPGENYRFIPPASSDNEIFWEVKVSKSNDARIIFMRDTHIIGFTP